VVCVDAMVDVTAVVVPELKVGVDDPAVGVMPEVGVGVIIIVLVTSCWLVEGVAVVDALLVGVGDWTGEDVDEAGADEDELSLMMVNIGLAFPESPNTCRNYQSYLSCRYPPLVLTNDDIIFSRLHIGNGDKNLTDRIIDVRCKWRV
jgi:hypothetical protein